MNKKIDIICPLYNAEKYIKDLDKNIKKQEKVNINSIKYVLTESKDNTEEILKQNNIDYIKIKQSEFSHSKTREDVAKTSKADIIVFISQDIVIERKDWLYNLVTPIINKEASASYSRQISKSIGIEKYTREKNYPQKSFIKSKKDLEKMGIKTFFFSDASSAIDNKVFKKLNYYDGKRFTTNEDMYMAYKLIMNGYKIKYAANSVVIHSHDLKLKDLYKRYYETGKFLKLNNYIDSYGTNKAGSGMAKYVLKRIIEEKDYKAFFRFWPDMITRYIATKMGKLNAEEGK